MWVIIIIFPTNHLVSRQPLPFSLVLITTWRSLYIYVSILLIIGFSECNLNGLQAGITLTAVSAEPRTVPDTQWLLHKHLLDEF